MAEIATNPPAPTESKSARKKREKSEQAAKASTATPTAPASNAHVEEKSPSLTNGDHGSDSPYIKELQKQVRNVSKKLASLVPSTTPTYTDPCQNAMSKVESILAENPNTSLDDLVASKKINADQKAQAQKRPGLQAQLAQLEEQMAQYKKIDHEYQSRLAAEKEALEAKYESELASVRASAKKEAEAGVRTVLRQKLLTFSQFLRAAAAKRIVEEEADTDESKAFEGALLLVYGGDDRAVQAAENIVEGAEESVPSTEGQILSVTYAQIRQLSLQHAPYIPEESVAEAATEEKPEATPPYNQTKVAVESDPTITNAGLTELGPQQGAAPPSNHAAKENGIPEQASAGGDGANLAAGRAWDNAGPTAGAEDLSESFEMVPRDPAETETRHATAEVQQTTSWADDAAAEAASQEAIASSTPPAPVNNDDGFHEVQSRRGAHRGYRGDGEGRQRGRGGRGGPFRGDRGRGGHRVDRGDRRGGDGGGRGRGGYRGPPRGS